MRLFYRILCLCCVLHASEGAAQWYDPQTGFPRGDDETRKTSGSLGAMLQIAANPDDFLHEWYNTDQSHVPNLKPASKVRIGDKIGAMLFYSGCVPKGAVCPLEVDFVISKPDGTTYGEARDLILSTTKAGSPGIVVLSRATMMIRLDPGDPPGRYAVVATLHSPATGKVFSLTQHFEVVE